MPNYEGKDPFKPPVCDSTSDMYTVLGGGDAECSLAAGHEGPHLCNTTPGRRDSYIVSW